MTMGRVFGVAALIGLLLAEGLAIAGTLGVEIVERWVTWISVLSFVEFGIAMIAMVAKFNAGKRFLVPREATAGGILIAIVLASTMLAPGHLEHGRPFETATGYAAKDNHGVILRRLSAEEFRGAKSAENAFGCASMAIFLYIAALRLLVPARAWSLQRQRRWGDLVGVGKNIGGLDVST